MTHAPKPLALLRDQTRLKTVHRQRVLRGGEAEPPPEIDLSRYLPAVIVQARASYQRLLESEYESIVVSAWMTSALARMGAPLDVTGAFGRVVEDEVRHVDICCEMVERLGGRPSIPSLATPPYPAFGAEAVAHEEVILGLVGFFCVGEELSRLIFRQALELAQEPLAVWAVSEIHRDEAFHGAFGFETAALYVPSMSDAGKLRVGGRVRDELARMEQRLGGPLPPGPAPEVTPEMAQLTALGLPPTPVLLKVFYDGVAREIVPRFSQLGVDVGVSVGAASP